MTGLQIFTLAHVLISLVGILSGFVVVFGLIAGRKLPLWTPTFLWTTVLTSVTGYFFPFTGFKPSYVVGAISLIALAIAIYALNSKHLVGGWRSTYVITSVVALWLNFFVLIAQAFGKIPALHALAPNGNEPPFLVAQIGALIVFIVLGYLATKKFRLVTVPVPIGAD
jgi:hypothetical protein